MSCQETRRAYPTDLSDQQWQLIERLMPPPIAAGRPREVDFREIINAVNYRSRTGCAWELLPHDLPPKSTVYEYYRAWQRDGTWQTIHNTLRKQVRQQAEKQPDATVGMLDSQSVKGTEMPGERGYDAGKKINGRKRHLLVDTLGLIIAVVITAASVQDRDGAKLVFAETWEPRLEIVWADGGYRGELIEWTSRNYPWKLEVVKRPADQKGFVLLPKRWVVERTFAWLGRYRLLSKEYEVTLESSTADIHIAMSHTMVRRLTRPPKPIYDHEHLLAQVA